MNRFYDSFLAGVETTHNVEVVYRYVDKERIPIDVTDLLRWQWVQFVSVFDRFIHDLVQKGIVDSFFISGIDDVTPKTRDLLVKMEIVVQLLFCTSEVDRRCILDNYIGKMLSYKSFQSPENVCDALSYIWKEKNKIKVISRQMGMESDYCKQYWNNIILRRNQIVHASDYIDNYGNRQDISIEDVEKTRDFMLLLGDAIIQSVC